MRTDDFRPSDNVEDDRAGSVGSGIGMPGGRGGLGIGTIVIIGLISWYFGIDPSVLLNGAQILTGGAPVTQQGGRAPPVTAGTPTDPTGRFVALVLGDTEDRWSEIFTASGRTYHPPKLRLFRGAEPGGCGLAQSAMGPFYCPLDQRIYLDTAFFSDLQNRFGGCTDSKACQFSEAYVIAHEVGHHVQDELGTLGKATSAQKAASSSGSGQRDSGPHRIAGRLPRRRVGEPRPAEAPFPRSGRCRPGAADRVRHRRRPPAKEDAGLRGAGFVHSRHVRAAQALVLERLQERRRGGLQYVLGELALTGGSRPYLQRTVRRRNLP